MDSNPALTMFQKRSLPEVPSNHPTAALKAGYREPFKPAQPKQTSSTASGRTRLIVRLAVPPGSFDWPAVLTLLYVKVCFLSGARPFTDLWNGLHSRSICASPPRASSICRPMQPRRRTHHCHSGCSSACSSPLCAVIPHSPCLNFGACLRSPHSTQQQYSKQDGKDYSRLHSQNKRAASHPEEPSSLSDWQVRLGALIGQ